MTTTSPLAISLLLTRMSTGSPASLSSSIMDPWDSSRMSLISLLRPAEFHRHFERNIQQQIQIAARPPPVRQRSEIGNWTGCTFMFRFGTAELAAAGAGCVRCCGAAPRICWRRWLRRGRREPAAAAVRLAVPAAAARPVRCRLPTAPAPASPPISEGNHSLAKWTGKQLHDRRIDQIADRQPERNFDDTLRLGSE